MHNGMVRDRGKCLKCRVVFIPQLSGSKNPVVIHGSSNVVNFVGLGNPFPHLGLVLSLRLCEDDIEF